MDRGNEANANILKKFADDTKWGAGVETAQDQACFQTGMDRLQEWADKWQMAFNVDKCHMLHMGAKNKKFKYQLGGRDLEPVEHEKDVGVIVSSDLRPSLQCARAASKANQVLGQISRGISYRDKNTFLKLYKTYVRPHLEYCQAAWSPWTEGDKKVLEQVQQRAIKMISNLKSREYEDRLREVGLTTLWERRQRGDMITMYRMMTGKDKVDSSLWFQMARQREGATATRQVTGHLNVETPLPGRLQMRRGQFSQRVAASWNGLPNWVKQSPTVNTFKNNLDKHWYPELVKISTQQASNLEKKTGRK